MKNDIIKQFNLPNYIKGKSFAEASKAIDNKFKDREDMYSNNTKKELLERLSQAQEFLKVKENVNTPQMQQAYGGYQNKMFLGGMSESDMLKTPGFNSEAEGGGTSTKPGIGSYLNVASTGLDLANTAFGDTGIDTSGQSKADRPNMVASIGGSALKGASAGMAFGPIGAGVGALVGGVAGLIGGNRAKKDAQLANSRNSLTLNSQYNDMADGGYVNDRSNPNINYDSIDKTFAKLPVSDNASLFDNNQINPAKTNNFGKGLLNSLGKAGDYLNNNVGSILRYSPVVTNSLQLANLGKPEVETLSRLQGKYKKSPLDTETLTNKIQNEYNNTSKALSEASGGSESTLRANLLGAQLNKTKGLSDMYMRSSEINRNEDKFAQQFDQNIRKTNLQQDNAEKDINARNRGAYNTNKSKLISQIGIDLGNIGKEEVSKKQISKLFGYDWMGNYMKKNPKSTKKEAQKALKKEISKINPNTRKASYGGYLKKKIKW